MLIIVLTFLEAIILIGFTIYLVKIHSSRKTTPIYVEILTMIGWFLAYAIILFIPLDIYLVSRY